MPNKHTRLPVTLYSAEQVRELDRIAIEDFKILGYTLMHRAALFSYQKLKEKWPNANSITVICGGGNNAGDGYVLAGLAKEEGKNVSVYHLFDPASMKGDAAKAYKYLLASGLKSSPYSTESLKNGDVIVDAIFGTGLDRNIEGEFADVINMINSTSTPVMSIDIPSGLNADTGNIMNVAVKAELTSTFIGLKKGLFTADGLEYSGEIKFNDLDVPKEVYEQLNQDNQSISRLELEDLDNVLKPRQKNSHKGYFGHVLVVGGDEGYLGAARMAAEAAARVGAGLVSVATRKSHASLLSTVRPELMSHGVETLDELMPLIKKANVIAIGPGLGQSEWAKLLLARVFESELSLVIDADALNLLTEEEQSSPNWIITPHPGEAARLLKTDSKTIQADRFQSINKLHENYPGPVVLKGSGTLIADTEGDLFICDAGNPGMSSGGMGDVLTGVIAGLIAQGIGINHATKLGVCIHANAADRAAQSGERGMMALDLMPHLRNLVNQ
ncbi:MAG: NAD(P)H-hydrate dehydratase [Proteobacteria bacterium]|nr:NAD(P)H-hydrate dehydratase [Pseudomonadota bacterium]NOG58984.1 NAD(P)H-hydrate dehydratase [Pseudomonadota bacterium]